MSVLDNLKNTAGTAREAVGSTAGAFKNMLVGTRNVAGTVGATAAAGTGGILGAFAWVAKGVTNIFLGLINSGFKVINRFPRISAFVVTFAAATGVIAWWERHQAQRTQNQEAMNLKTSIAANKEARLETSLAMGEASQFPDSNWRGRVKGGLPGQQLPN